MRRFPGFRYAPRCAAALRFTLGYNRAPAFAGWPSRPTKRFDAFSGFAYSYVAGGLAIAIPHGPGVPYNYNNNFAPVVGGRFSF
jgi:hypothetical protein